MYNDQYSKWQNIPFRPNLHNEEVVYTVLSPRNSMWILEDYKQITNYQECKVYKYCYGYWYQLTINQEKEEWRLLDYEDSVDKKKIDRLYAYYIATCQYQNATCFSDNNEIL